MKTLRENIQDKYGMSDVLKLFKSAITRALRFGRIKRYFLFIRFVHNMFWIGSLLR